MSAPARRAAALAAWVSGGPRLRRRLLALAAGAVGALALAPLDLWPAMALSLVPAVWLLDGCAARRREAFFIGWLWGFGYFVAGLWWLGAAFLVEADQFAWALPLGVLGLPAALALFPALGFLLAALVWPHGPARVCAFACALALSEWLRGHVLTGFPWNAPGMALAADLRLAQGASIFGLHGLTLLALLIFSAPATLADRPGRWRLWPSGLAGAALLALFAFGAARLHGAREAFVPGVEVRVMQPDMALDDSFRAEFRDRIVARYLALSALDEPAPAGDRILLAWPESAFPFILSRDERSLSRIASTLPEGAVLATGAARAEENPEDPDGPPLYFNAIHLLTHKDGIVATYDKTHLVPFGEYLPFEALLTRLGLRQFVLMPGGFSAGGGRRALTAPGLPPMAPLICYEAIFPGEALPDPEPGAPASKLLLNVTDDGWFGRTFGPHQHFAQARLRAIEEGLPLVRAANTGISAVTDPYGRVLSSLPLGAAGLIRSPLPEAAAPPFFARHGAVAGLLLWMGGVFVTIAAFLRRS